MVTTLPPPDDIERASKFTREPFLSEGEDPASLLAPGSAHRRAFDSALAEMDAGLKVPSVAWRRNFSLLLGLERLLSQDQPGLVDGTVLSAHQVDVLSGTLTALLAEAQRNGDSNGNGVVSEAEVELAPVGIPGEEELDEDEPDEPQDWDEPIGRRRGSRSPRRRGSQREQALLVRARHRAPARRSPRSASPRPRAPAAS